MKKLFVGAFALCLGLTSFAQDAVTFKLNPDIGKSQESTMVMKTDIDSPQPVIMDMHMNTTTLSSEIKDGNIIYETTINTVKMDMQSGMETVSYDSQGENTDETSKMIDSQFRPLIGKKIISTISPAGKQIDIELPEISGNTLSASSFTNQFTEFPDHAITLGESWVNSVEVEENPVFQKLEIENTYKEKSAEGYVIAFLGKMLNAQNEQTGTIEGHYVLDTRTFMPLSSQAVSTIEFMETKITSTIETAIK